MVPAVKFHLFVVNIVFLILDIIISIDLSNLKGDNSHKKCNISVMTHHMTPSLMQDKLFNNNA
jgi:hypothetical protein